MKSLFSENKITSIYQIAAGDLGGIAQGYPLTVPKIKPTLAVMPIDNMPQKVTREMAVKTEAPPTKADRPPNNISDNSEIEPTVVINGMILDAVKSVIIWLTWAKGK